MKRTFSSSFFFYFLPLLTHSWWGWQKNIAYFHFSMWSTLQWNSEKFKKKAPENGRRSNEVRTKYKGTNTQPKNTSLRELYEAAFSTFCAINFKIHPKFYSSSFFPSSLQKRICFLIFWVSFSFFCSFLLAKWNHICWQEHVQSLNFQGKIRRANKFIFRKLLVQCRGVGRMCVC